VTTLNLVTKGPKAVILESSLVHVAARQSARS